jgi:hypothetical protein
LSAVEVAYQRRPLRGWRLALIMGLCLFAATVLAVVWAVWGPRQRVPLVRGQMTRLLQDGEALTFTGWMTASGPTGRTSTSYGRTVSYKTFPAKLPGFLTVLRQRVQVHTVKGMSGGEILVGQDSDHALRSIGIRRPDGRQDLALDVPVQMCGRLSRTSAWSYVSHFQSGNVEEARFRVVGVEWVRTPMAEFEAYKIQLSRRTAGWSEHALMWVTPDFPVGVKSDSWFTSGTGSSKATIHFVVTLSKVSGRSTK